MRAAILVLFLGGCLSSEQAGAEFEAYVEEHNACEQDSDCALCYPDCPLGCFTAVSAAEVEACERRADEIVAAYERGGSRCEYDCAAPGVPYCDEGRCRVDAE